MYAKMTAVTKNKSGGFKRALVDNQGEGTPPAPQRSIVGWVVFVSNIRDDTDKGDVHDLFSEFGTIKRIPVNMDRCSRFTKRYALIEYENENEALAAIEALNGTEFIGRRINIGWCFVRGGDK